MDCSSVQTGNICPLKQKHKWAVEIQSESVYFYDLFLICEIPFKSLLYVQYDCCCVFFSQPDVALYCQEELKYLKYWQKKFFPYIQRTSLKEVIHVDVMQSFFGSVCRLGFLEGSWNPKRKSRAVLTWICFWFKCGKYELPWRCTIPLHYLFEAGIKAGVNWMFAFLN